MTLLDSFFRKMLFFPPFPLVVEVKRSMEEDHQAKAHKKRLSGNKAVKRDEARKKKLGIETRPNRGHNMKAFTGPSAGSHKVRAAMRGMEKREVDLKVPTIDKTFSTLLNEPPLLVAAVGPANSGKTTLLRSMIKFYSGRNIQSLRGPVTVVAGRTRRVTFVECPNTLSAMCDVAKVADVVLLMLDGSYGFEMETFEFLSIAQVHGMPRIVGVISHLDRMKTNKQLKKHKRMLRHRFWHEVAEGAKLLCLAPMTHGMYRASDVLKLHRILVCAQPHVQAWRNTHSCVLVDRHEDITNPDKITRDERCNRTVATYGYVRGHPMREGQMVHIPGMGDLRVKHLSRQDDPCPPVASDAKSQGSKLRHLTKKQKQLYAPYSSVDGLLYDEEGIYLQEDPERQNITRSGEGLEMLRELQRSNVLDGRLEGAEVDVVRRPVTFAEEADTLELHVDEKDLNRQVRAAQAEESSNDSDSDGEVEDPMQPFAHIGGNGAAKQVEAGATSSDDDEGDENGVALAPRDPHDLDSIRLHTVINDWGNAEFCALVKNLFVTGEWKEEEGGRAKRAREESAEGSDGDGAIDDGAADDDEIGSRGYESVDEVGNEEGGEQLVATKKGPSPKISEKQKLHSNESFDDDVDEEEQKEGVAADGGDTTVRDPEAQQLIGHFLMKENDHGANFNDELGVSAPADSDDEDGKHPADDDDANVAPSGDASQDDYIKKKMAKKQLFDEGYDTKGGKNATHGYHDFLMKEADEKQKALDNTLQLVGEDLDKRIALIGYFSGLYVRMVFEDVPVEFVRNHDPKVPLLVGGLNAGEEEQAITQARLKRHRWYPRILKAQDPLVISIGWRRIQVQPIYATEDPNGRVRYLKYTPKHMHCVTSFYAPVVPPNTGFIAIPAQETKTPFFRCLATGYTMNVESSTIIVKKLKITGVPQKIQKTTCFVKGMFTSDIEAAKFVGAKVRSVSGLRGIIKKVCKGKSGLIRCTFEDKLLMSDIVFLRTWKPVSPPRYCATVPTLLDKEWTGMRTMAQLRRDYKIPLPSNGDSEYREIKRRKVIDDTAPIRIPLSRNTRTNLPYELKEDYVALVQTDEARDRARAATTVAPEPREQQRRAMLDMFREKAEKMGAKKKEAKKRAREKQAHDSEKTREQYERALKVAKKETARMREFRSQHKSRKE